MHVIPVSKETEQCMQHCDEAHHVCVELLTYCVEKGGRYTEPELICLLRDCAEICQTSANFMLRGSDMHANVCNACAEICRRCAEACQRFSDDEKMRTCAEICRRCAEVCQRMGQMAPVR